MGRRTFSSIAKNNCEDFFANEWALVACRISTAIPSIIGIEFLGSEVIVFEDSTTREIFLYGELGQLIIQSQGPTVVPNEVG
jgi:hypothetical protein